MWKVFKLIIVFLQIIKTGLNTNFIYIKKLYTAFAQCGIDREKAKV